ncbi:MAG TPA: hypothetical protein PKY12_10695, partial [Catalimonadaceae bacterium]|nr:hypothetical protein [Catalimonadaceae bacterium]
ALGTSIKILLRQDFFFAQACCLPADWFRGTSTCLGRITKWTNWINSCGSNLADSWNLLYTRTVDWIFHAESGP